MHIAEEDAEGILPKIVQICRAELAPLLRQFARTMGDDGASQVIIRAFLRHLSSYLPYPRVSRAVLRSFEGHGASRLSVSPSSDAEWIFFFQR